MWLFIGTLVFGGCAMAILPQLLGFAEAQFDYAAGRLYGLSEKQVDELRKIERG